MAKVSGKTCNVELNNEWGIFGSHPNREVRAKDGKESSTLNLKMPCLRIAGKHGAGILDYWKRTKDGRAGKHSFTPETLVPVICEELEDACREIPDDEDEEEDDSQAVTDAYEVLDR